MTTARCSVYVLTHSPNRQTARQHLKARWVRARNGFNNLCEDLEAMRLAYQDGSLTVAEILKRYDIGTTKLYNLIREHNWTLRSLKTEKTPVAATGQSRSGNVLELPLATLKRLRKIARQYVRELENENKPTTGESGKDNKIAQSASERERSVRSLRTLLKIIEEIADLEARFKSIAGKTGRKEIDNKQREELARRIKALRDKNR